MCVWFVHLPKQLNKYIREYIINHSLNPLDWYVGVWEIWRNSIAGHTWVILCYCQMKMELMWLWKDFKIILEFNCFVYHKQSNWLKRGTMHIYNIIDNSLIFRTYRSPMLWHIIKGEHVRDLILIRWTYYISFWL